MQRDVSTIGCMSIDEDSSCFSRNKFALSVMNFLGCIKETMDNSFFYGMMEENTSKKAVYTAGFLLAVPSQLSIPYDLPIEKM